MAAASPHCERERFAQALAALQLASTASSVSPSAVRAAYKAALIRHHPDKPGGDPTAFFRVQAAFETLRAAEDNAPEQPKAAPTEATPASSATAAVVAAMGAARSRSRVRRRAVTQVVGAEAGKSRSRRAELRPSPPPSLSPSPSPSLSPPLFQTQPRPEPACLELASHSICQRLRCGGEAVFATGTTTTAALALGIWVWRGDAAPVLEAEAEAATAAPHESIALVRWIEAQGWVGLAAATSCGRILKWKLEGEGGRPVRITSYCALDPPYAPRTPPICAAAAAAPAARPMDAGAPAPAPPPLFFLTAVADGCVTAWDVERDVCLGILPQEHSEDGEARGRPTAISGAAAGQLRRGGGGGGGALAAAGFESGRTLVWRLPRGDSRGIQMHTLFWDNGPVTGVEFTPCGRMLVVATASPPHSSAAAAPLPARARVLLWSAVTGHILRWLDGHRGSLITSMTWLSRCGGDADDAAAAPPLLLTAATDGCLLSWRLAAEPTGALGPLWTAALEPDDDHDEEELQPPALPRQSIVCLATAPDATRIAVGRRNGRLCIVDAATRRVVHSHAANAAGHPLSCSWSTDGKAAIALHGDGVVRGWRAGGSCAARHREDEPRNDRRSSGDDGGGGSAAAALLPQPNRALGIGYRVDVFGTLVGEDPASLAE